jgi:catechol 2,3-dioxygenase-like lactoylglutathione lyase family enzyme
VKSTSVRTFLASLALSVAFVASAAAVNPPQPEHGHFHHVHINVSDIAKTTEFYSKVFGVVPIRYGNLQTALMAERAFIFMNQVEPPIKSQLQTGIIHIGWSGIDHLAFSFRDLNAAFKRVTGLGIPIEKAITKDKNYGIDSFFVRAPNGILVELVKAKPLPDAAWE